MAEVSGLDGIDWNGPITVIVTGLVSLLVEYLRRRMPPERNNRRHDDNEYEETIKENEDEGV